MCIRSNLRQHKPQIAKDILFLGSNQALCLLTLRKRNRRNHCINVISIKPQHPTLPCTSRSAETAPKTPLNDNQAHRTLTAPAATPYSSTCRPAPKRIHHPNSSTLQRRPAAAPCNRAAPKRTHHSDSSTLKHPAGAPCSDTLQRHEQARSKAH